MPVIGIKYLSKASYVQIYYIDESLSEIIS